MRFRLTASAALAFGVSAGIPTRGATTRPDSPMPGGAAVRLDRDEWHEHYREHDFEEDVDMRDVPERVRETVEHERNGRRVASAQRVRHGDGRYYRFHLEGRHKKDLILRVAHDGRLLDVEREDEPRR